MKRTVIGIAALLVASLAMAELPAKKQQELTAAGISDRQAGQNQGQPTHSTLAKSIQAPQRPSRDTATMTYDDGTISALPTVFGKIYGNKFSQGVGGAALGTVTLNSFSFYFAENAASNTGLFFQPADPGGAASINPRESINISGLVNAGASFSNLTTINLINQSALGTTGVFNDTFYLGAWCLNVNTTVPVGDKAIGLSTNGPRRQGYTADVGATGTVAMAAQPWNAVLRANVTSTVTVPVELMAFGAE